MTTAPHTQALIEHAMRFYDERLVYHGWSHAEQVMRDVARIIREVGALNVAVDQDMLLVAAAWHDAGYNDPRADEFESKEHYSVFLAKREIGQQLGEDGEVLAQAILATRKNVQRTTPEEIILHYADVANMGYEYGEFMQFTMRLWYEYGSPEWSKFVEQADRAILQCAAEAERELPLIGLPIDTPSSFPVMSRANTAQLRQEPAPR
ncbi:MAG: HD domain-containing protein [Candidatus Saccharimonas sp.]